MYICVRVLGRGPGNVEKIGGFITQISGTRFIVLSARARARVDDSSKSNGNWDFFDTRRAGGKKIPRIISDARVFINIIITIIGPVDILRIYRWAT